MKVRFIVFFLWLLVCFVVVGALDVIDRSDEVKYNVLIVEELGTPEEGSITIPIVSPADKRKYTCWLPPPWREDEETALDEEIPSISTLLEPLQHTCLYRISGWWTYEFCFGKSVRQFHQEKDKPLRPQDEFYLGRKLDQDEGVETEQYYSETYEGGTVCDLTGEKRKTEVRFFCGNEKIGSSILDLKEPSSCAYLLSISTPLLCKHPNYKPPKEKLQTIKCFTLEKSPAPQSDITDVDAEDTIDSEEDFVEVEQNEHQKEDDGGQVNEEKRVKKPRENAQNNDESSKTHTTKPPKGPSKQERKSKVDNKPVDENKKKSRKNQAQDTEKQFKVIDLRDTKETKADDLDEIEEEITVELPLEDFVAQLLQTGISKEQLQQLGLMNEEEEEEDEKKQDNVL